MRRRLATLATLGLVLPMLMAPTPTLAAPPPSGLAAWAAVVVAGDDHASHTEALTETFDNARRDVATGFVRRGFTRDRVAQFSLRPQRYPDTRPSQARLSAILERLRTSAAASTGCLVYFTSHGSPDGVVLGDSLVSPKRLAAMVGSACGTRPTAVIVSACFSGVFLPALRAPSRLVLTAARADRSSFGCGESDHYPFFDGCVVEDLPSARDFIDLAARVRRCVAAREDSQGMRPRSEPQVFVGGAFSAASPPFSVSAADGR